MLWFCGGHGTCLTGEGTAGHLEAASIAWLQRYVDAPQEGQDGPGLRVAGRRRGLAQRPRFPPKPGAPVVGEGSGTLALTPADAVSGSPTAAAPAANAVNVPIPDVTAQVVGRPRAAAHLLRHRAR